MKSGETKLSQKLYASEEIVVRVYGVPDKYCGEVQSTEERASKIKEVLERRFNKVTLEYIDLTQNDADGEVRSRIQRGAKLPLVYMNGELLCEGELRLHRILKKVSL